MSLNPHGGGNFSRVLLIKAVYSHLQAVRSASHNVSHNNLNHVRRLVLIMEFHMTHNHSVSHIELSGMPNLIQITMKRFATPQDRHASVARVMNLDRESSPSVDL